MKMKKVALLLVLVMICSMFYGCEGKKTTQESAEKQPVSYEGLMTQWKEDATTDHLTCWFTSESDKKWLEEAAMEFEKQYAVKVNLVYYDGISFFEDMNKENQKGTGPDMYILGNDQLQLATESGMAEENAWLDDAFWKENFPEVAKNAVTYKDKQYGYPIYFDTYCLVYDANLLETAPASIDDIIAFLDAYEDTGSTKAVFRWDVADPYINSMFIASYANLFGENGDDPSAFQVNNEKCIATMEYFQSLSAYLWMNKNNISHDTILNRIKDGTLVLGLCKSDILPTLYEMQAVKENTTEADAESDTSQNEGESTEDSDEADNAENTNETASTNYQISYVPSLTAELSSTSFSTTYSAFVNPYGVDNSLGNMFALFLSAGYSDHVYNGNGKLSVVDQKDAFNEMQKIVYAQYLNSKPVPKVMIFGDYISESGITFDAIWEGQDAKEQLDLLQQTMEEKLK